nr:DUF1612 domain-containing protein [Sinorhizobium meliloti]
MGRLGNSGTAAKATLARRAAGEFLRARGKVASHLFGLNLGLKAVPRERRRLRCAAARCP